MSQLPKVRLRVCQHVKLLLEETTESLCLVRLRLVRNRGRWEMSLNVGLYGVPGSKYRGDPTKIIYRSLWERKFMIYCDANVNVLEWASEEVIIPYKDPT